MFINSVQLQHLARNAKQRIRNPQVGIIGGYHGGNLGDIALGTSIADVLKQQNINSGLQTIYNLEKWPVAAYAIIGGGAVGYVDSLRKVAKRYKDQNNHVAFVGVDFMEKSYPEDCLLLLQRAAFISCRSEAQAKKIEALTGRRDIHFHPDIGFSLYNGFCSQQRQRDNTSRKKKLLINVLPLYAKMSNHEYVPEIRYKIERPELFENFYTMHDSYKQVVRQIVEQSLAEGFTIESIPFTPADNAYAQIMLKGLPVKYQTYHSSPKKMMEYMAEAQRVVATRFHATIFALKLGVQLYPMAYATKNKLMLQELGFDNGNYLSTDDFARGKSTAKKSIVAKQELITTAEETSLSFIRSCVSSVISS